MTKGNRPTTPNSLREKCFRKFMAVIQSWKNVSAGQKRVCCGPINICKHIKEKAARFGVCNKYRNYQIEAPYLAHPVPDRPWQVLAVYIFSLLKFVVLLDYNSKYFELTQPPLSTVENSIWQDIEYWTVEVFFDNGLEFSGLEFQQFAKQYQFQPVILSPRMSQSNGSKIPIQRFWSYQILRQFQELGFHLPSYLWSVAQEASFLFRISS